MNRDNQRRKRTAAEKLRIVLTGMDSGVKLAEFCRREGISATQYYTWKKRLMGAANAIFDDRKQAAHEERSQAEMQRMKNVIAEITAENLDLKKGLSG
jgi:transposase-like protein